MRLIVSTFALLAGLSTGLAAQSAPHGLRLSLGLHFPLGANHREPICDGSEMASVQSRRSIGKVLIFGGLGAALVSSKFVDSSNPATALDVLSAGIIASAAGAYLHYNSNPSSEFWQNAVPQIKVGASRADEVRQCFGNPSGTTASGSDATWTYQASSTGFLGMGGSARSLSITLKDGLVTKVSKSEFGF